MEDLLRWCHLARESLCTMAGGTANRAEVGMTQLRIPVRKGKREEDGVGGTWCLRDDYHIARESNVTGCSTFQWDRGALEVAEHVYHRGEVQVLYPALSTLCEHQA